MKKAGFGFYAALTLLLMAWGYYQAIYVAPTDAMQGEIFRIIFYHVPLFNCAFTFFTVSFAGSVGFLAFRHSHPERAQIADAWALAGAEVGVVCCTNALILGSMWGRRAWGIWWTWDARLTTTLVLWLIYMSYLLMRRFSAGPQVQSLSAVLGIVGALDMPIVYMSIRWWRTQHPAPVFFGGPDAGMDKSMLPAFFWNIAGWGLWGIFILIFRFALERRRQIADQEAALQAIEASLETPQ
jgi:heme exporter protein C